MEDKTDKARITKIEGEGSKQKKIQREKKKKFRKPTVKEKIEIVRMIEEKQKEEKDLIEIRMVEEIVLRRFHKYLKMFEKKE